MSNVVRCRAPARRPRYPGETCKRTVGWAGEGVTVRILEHREEPPPGQAVLVCPACGTIYALDLVDRNVA